MDAAAVIARLGLVPHPEGGHYAETWRAPSGNGERPAGSAIYYLLREGERSAWHRIDAAETWHFYAGHPLGLFVAPPDGLGAARHVVLGADLDAGQRPQYVVEPGEWQAARPLGPWSLVGCTVAPAFSFDRLELAEPGWEPGP